MRKRSDTPTGNMLLLVLFFLLVHAASADVTLRVCSDGRGDFSSVQRALDSLAPGTNASLGRVTLRLSGAFRERVTVYSNFSGGVTFLGVANCAPLDGALAPMAPLADAPAPTSPLDVAYIVYNLSATNGTSVAASASLVVDTDDFILDGVCVGNDAAGFNKERAGQSLALYLSADRGIVANSMLIGGQDTLLTGNYRSLFTNTYINGSCDSIYGVGSALFESCDLEIFDTVTAHRGNGTTAYLFDACAVVPTQPRTLLGRPWGPNATVVFKSCEMNSNVDPVGWGDWGKGCTNHSTPAACDFITYAEFNSTQASPSPPGLPVNVSARVWWSQQLDAAQASAWNQARVLGDWQPQRPPQRAWNALTRHHRAA